MKVVGAMVLVLGFAVAAQAGGGNTAHFSMSPSVYSEGGGGGAGGGGLGGGSRVLPHIPSTRFAVRSASGSASDYIPSTFVSYDSAIAEGQASLSAHPQPLGTYAKEDKPAGKTATVEIVQEQDGEVAIQKR